MKCKRCGCTDDDCTGCYDRTGVPCFWVQYGMRGRLCSACCTLDELIEAHAKGLEVRAPEFNQKVREEIHRRIDEFETTNTKRK
jgi:hypothetical protein